MGSQHVSKFLLNKKLERVTKTQEANTLRYLYNSENHLESDMVVWEAGALTLQLPSKF